MNQEKHPSPAPRSSRRRAVKWLFGVGLLWGVLAYFAIPLVWDGYSWIAPSIDDNPRLTQTSDRHPGGPLNVELTGSEQELKGIMKAAGWYGADALGIDSDLKIAADTVLSRPDAAAPVSNLYLFGRKEDLAYEQPVDDNPRQRHHVRFWRTKELSVDGRPQWIGAAIYDERVGLSRTTGQITHVTAPDVDAERDYLFECLEKTGLLESHSIEHGFQSQLTGRNGGGDPWRTDGDLYRGVLKATDAGNTSQP
ncbi:hypothetical protein FF011L_27300 [Roseimaritima multifibrata]|uniref:LssY-like C-terminal domain-containing protein n=1 Tax=Roseimaritima multifibrata TaxID=1930274 RepID=A0A517MGD5_9BACT|nr:LssY C-terminal domain-containing protein [Roseimaritima multifibrata]QDS93953.1 hypothetical protein FF011L_27300 [Roseimaritima multifibrata]